MNGDETLTDGPHARGGRKVRPCGLLAGVAVLSLLVSGCVHRPVELAAPVELPASFSRTGEAVVPDRWWTALGDEKLNALVDEARSGNLSLKGAWDRLAQARAVARKEGAGLFPSLQASGNAARSLSVTRNPSAIPGAGGGGGPGSGKSREYWNSFSLGLAASYELDLWGRVRSTRKAAMLDVVAGKQDLHATAIALSAEVAGAWYRLVELRGQLALLRRQIKTNEDFLETITLRFRRGKVPAADVIQQRQTLEAVKGERFQTRASLQAETHYLAVLLGRSPGDFDAPADSGLPALPPMPKTGIPAERVQRRPDVQAAFLRVQAADKRVAAAVADRFPRISFSASASTSAGKMRDLFDNWLASMAANVLAPLFDGFRRKAEVARTRAVVSERMHAYGERLLGSMEEVENALIREARQREYAASLDEQLKLSREAMAQTLNSYKKGSMDFTRFLSTHIAHQRLERTRVQAQRDLVLYRIALYRALAGGWELAPPLNTVWARSPDKITDASSNSKGDRDGDK